MLTLLSYFSTDFNIWLSFPQEENRNDKRWLDWQWEGKCCLRQVSSYWAFWPAPPGDASPFLSSLSYTFWHWWGEHSWSYCSHALTPNSTPMYFFLSNLSFLDLCFTTVLSHRCFGISGDADKTISYTGCDPAVCCSGAGLTECVLLTVMAYDRFNAICRPLHYGVIMHPKLLQQLAALAWIRWLCGVHSSRPSLFYNCLSAAITWWMTSCVKSLPWLRLPVWTQPSWKMSSP